LASIKGFRKREPTPIGEHIFSGVCTMTAILATLKVLGVIKLGWWVVGLPLFAAALVPVGMILVILYLAGRNGGV
jgi:UDP-N-acetylglucosamine:LPS N-acetylglucosamine transferase